MANRGIPMSESATRKLMKKSDTKMAGQEYPEQVDQIVKLQERCDKLERALAKEVKDRKILECMFYGHVEQHVKRGHPV